MLTTKTKLNELQNAVDYLKNELEYYNDILTVRNFIDEDEIEDENEIEIKIIAHDMYEKQIKNISEKLGVVSIQLEDTKKVLAKKENEKNLMEV